MEESIRASSRGRACLLAVCALCALGCEHLGTTRKFKNPVVPPPPRRVAGAIQRDANLDESVAGQLAEDRAAGSGRAGRASLADRDLSEGATQRSTRMAGASGGRSDRLSARGGSGDSADDGRDDERSQIAQSSATTGGESAGWQSKNVARRSMKDDWKSDHAHLEGEEPTAVRTSTETEVDGYRLPHGDIAATVNDRPIFVDDVLHDHRLVQYLAHAREQLPPEKYRKLRAQLVEQRLPMFIQQELLVQALKTKVPDEQLEKMLKSLDTQFEKQALPELIKQSGVSTAGELEVKLREIGRSIDSERQNYCNTQMAQQYVGMNAKPQAGFDRPEILDHYQQNKDRFFVPGEVRWQQIRLSFDRNGGKARAQRLAREMLGRLQGGEDFGELARKYSDGATKSNGGLWPWTIEASLTSPELDQALFEMPVGEEFALVETEKSFEIVAVLDRHERGHKSFPSVQHDIKNELKQAQIHRNVKELLAELEAKATIERYTDRL
ncbi:MAG: peptidylprolyl isomerase [Planctomycetaceae bacterium]